MFTREETARDLSALLQTIKNQRQRHNKLQPLILDDIIRSLPALQKIVWMLSDRQFSDKLIKLHVNDFLKERWLRIRNTPLCYTQNTDNCVTWYWIRCVEWMAGRAKNSLLMPTVMTSDIYLNELDELALGSFILTDDATRFIHISSWIENTIKSMVLNGQLVFQHYDQEKEGFVNLSKDESTKLSKYCSRMRDLYECLPRSTHLEKMQKLCAGLFEGSVGKKGSEAQAAQPALVAIAEFFTYFNCLTKQTQEVLCAYSADNYTMLKVINRLRRTHNPNTDSLGDTCTKTSANMLNQIIEKNHAAMRNLPLEMSIENLIYLASNSDGHLDKLHELKPNIELQKDKYQYGDYCKFDISELYLENHYEKAFALLFNFISQELDRLISTNTPDSKKVDHYLTILFSMGKECLEFKDRKINAQEAILHEIVARIVVVSDIKRLSDTQYFKNFVSLFHHSTSKSHLIELFKQNHLTFSSIGLSTDIPKEKRSQLERILENDHEYYRLNMIESEDIARSYATSSTSDSHLAQPSQS